MIIRKNNKDKFVRVSNETHEMLRSIKEIRGCSFPDTVEYVIKKYMENNGEIHIALLNEYFESIKKIFVHDTDSYEKIEIFRAYLIQKLRGVEKSDEILKQNLIFNNSKKLTCSEMVEENRKRKGEKNHMKVTRKNKTIMIEATIQSESDPKVEYRVEIEISNDEKMYVFCSCPDFQSRGMICKHLWKIIYDEHLEKYVPKPQPQQNEKQKNDETNSDENNESDEDRENREKELKQLNEMMGI